MTEAQKRLLKAYRPKRNWSIKRSFWRFVGFLLFPGLPVGIFLSKFVYEVPEYLTNMFTPMAWVTCFLLMFVSLGLWIACIGMTHFYTKLLKDEDHPDDKIQAAIKATLHFKKYSYFQWVCWAAGILLFWSSQYYIIGTLLFLFFCANFLLVKATIDTMKKWVSGLSSEECNHLIDLNDNLPALAPAAQEV